MSIEFQNNVNARFSNMTTEDKAVFLAHLQGQVRLDQTLAEVEDQEKFNAFLDLIERGHVPDMEANSFQDTF